MINITIFIFIVNNKNENILRFAIRGDLLERERERERKRERAWEREREREKKRERKRERKREKERERAWSF